MLVNRAGLDAMFSGFNTFFSTAFSGATTHYKSVAMVIPSRGREEKYGFLGQIPTVREWVGDRVIKNLSAHDFTITNKTFESTISVKRVDVEDDRYGVLAPAFSEMGKAAAEQPDKLVFGLLGRGFTEPCYDSQNFFDTDHPVGDGNGGFVSVSNMQAGAEPAWYLLDTSRAVKPIVYQERVAYKLARLDDDRDENVFLKDEFLYGSRGRSNAGFGMWQLAFASKAELTAENYEAGRAAMMSLKGDEGRPLGIKPNVLVVPPTLEGASMRLLNNGSRVVLVGEAPVAVQNEWAGTAKPIVTPWVL